MTSRPRRASWSGRSTPTSSCSRRCCSPGASSVTSTGARRSSSSASSSSCIASTACAFATTPGMLIAFRALMGVGGAAVLPTTLAIITVVFPPHERGKAIGAWAGAVGAAVALGPVLGGILLEHPEWSSWLTGNDWGSVFLINLPIVIVGLFFIWRVVPETRNPHPRKLDLARPGHVGHRTRAARLRHHRRLGHQGLAGAVRHLAHHRGHRHHRDLPVARVAQRPPELRRLAVPQPRLRGQPHGGQPRVLRDVGHHVLAALLPADPARLHARSRPACASCRSPSASSSRRRAAPRW